jgi:hypothetical protein
VKQDDDAMRAQARAEALEVLPALVEKELSIF